MKKSMKIVSVALIMIAIILVSTSAFANNISRPSDVTFDQSNTENVAKIGSSVLGIIRVVGTIVAVGMIIILGIKYMMGSAEERAEYKKTLFPYFIGAIMIFAATNLADMVYSWAQGL